MYFTSFMFRLFQPEIWDKRLISFIRRSAVIFSGAAEEASTVFGNVAGKRLQEICVSLRINSSEGETNAIEQRTDSDKASKDTSLWQPEHVPEENQQDLVTKQLGVDTNGWDLNTPSPVLSQVISLSQTSFSYCF